MRLNYIYYWDKLQKEFLEETKTGYMDMIFLNGFHK